MPAICFSASFSHRSPRLPPRPLALPCRSERHDFNLHHLNDSLLPKEALTEPRRGAELQQGRGGRDKMGTGDTATKSSGDLLYIGSPRLGAEGNQCPPPPFLLQPSVGLSASFSLSRLEFLGVRLGQRSRGNQFPSPGTPPCAQAAPPRHEMLAEELSPGIPRPPVCLGIRVWGAALEV